MTFSSPKETGIGAYLGYSEQTSGMGINFREPDYEEPTFSNIIPMVISVKYT